MKEVCMNRLQMQRIFFYCMLIAGINTDCRPKSNSVIHSIASLPISIVHMVKSTKDVMIIAGTISAIIIIYKVGLMTYTWDIVRSPTRIAAINKRTENIQKTQTTHTTQLQTILEKLTLQDSLLQSLSTQSRDTNKTLHDYLVDFELFKRTTNIHHDDIIRNIQAIQTRLEGQNSALELLIKQQIATMLPQLLAALGATSQTTPDTNPPQIRRTEPSRNAA